MWCRWFWQVFSTTFSLRDYFLPTFSPSGVLVYCRSVVSLCFSSPPLTGPLLSCLHSFCSVANYDHTTSVFPPVDDFIRDICCFNSSSDLLILGSVHFSDTTRPSKHVHLGHIHSLTQRLCCCPRLCSVRHGRPHRSLLCFSFNLCTELFVTQNAGHPFPTRLSLWLTSLYYTLILAICCTHLT